MFCAITVKVYVPVVVGVPEMTPVDALSDNPGGSGLMLVMRILHVIGVVPVAARVVL